MSEVNSYPVDCGSTVRLPHERVDCAVVIVTYNSDVYIGELLACLTDAAPGLSLRVVVVDNGSTDATVDTVARRSGVTCVKARRNDGYAAGINIGRMHAGDYSALLVLNPDLLLEAGSVTQMYNALQAPGIGIVVPMLMDQLGNVLPSIRREPTVMRALGDCLFGQHLRARPG
jgi:GT2 family glycosyltransferase